MGGYDTKFRNKVRRPHQIPGDTACADVPSPVSDSAFLGEFLNHSSPTIAPTLIQPSALSLGPSTM